MKCEHIRIKLDSKKLRHKGNPQENLGADDLIACVAPRCAFFVGSYVASRFDSYEWKRPPISALNHLIYTASLCLS